VKVEVSAPGTNDRLYVPFSALGIPQGEAACLQIVSVRKFSSAGVLYNTANDIDTVSLVALEVGGEAKGRCIHIVEGTTGFADGDYYEIDLQAVADIARATATAYTAT
jgi:hypothetical protein